MEDLTTLARVETEWQPVTPANQALVVRLIGRASRLIRRRVTDVDARILSGALDAELVADVATSMVVRVLRNPEGLREVAVDDVRAVRDTTLSSGQLTITVEELADLAPPESSGGLGSIVPRWSEC